MKKIFRVILILSVFLYAVLIYYLLFRLASRQMVITSADMLDNYNYWNSVNLIPFKTIAQYISGTIAGNNKAHAIKNLAGNLFLFFPAGFYLPFLIRKTNKLIIYAAIMAALIITVEIIQVLTMTGSFDIDDFILNFTGAILSFFFFTRTPLFKIFKLLEH